MYIEVLSEVKRMQRIKDKSRLYKKIILIETLVIMLLMFLINMLYSHYEITREHINNFIQYSQVMNSYVTSREDVKKLFINYRMCKKIITPSII